MMRRELWACGCGGVDELLLTAQFEVLCSGQASISLGHDETTVVLRLGKKTVIDLLLCQKHLLAPPPFVHMSHAAGAVEINAASLC